MSWVNAYAVKYPTKHAITSPRRHTQPWFGIIRMFIWPYPHKRHLSCSYNSYGLLSRFSCRTNCTIGSVSSYTNHLCDNPLAPTILNNGLRFRPWPISYYHISSATWVSRQTSYLLFIYNFLTLKCDIMKSIDRLISFLLYSLKYMQGNLG